MGMLSVTPPELANLDATISSRAADATVAKPDSQLSGQIKSIQRGVISISGAHASATATISAVNPAKTVVHFGGFLSDNDSVLRAPHLVLTDATTVTATRNATANTTTVAYTVEERY